MKKFKAFLETFDSPRILDVGTGRGSFIEIITSMYDDYEKIVGIDISKRAIDFASEAFKENSRIKFVERDILNTGFPKEHFDIVCLANSLHHLDKIDETLIAMEELTKPEGFIVISEMLSDDLTNAQVSHRLIHHFAAKIDRELGRIHNDTYTKKEILDILNNTSLEVVDFHELEYEQPNISKEDVNSLINQVNLLLNQLDDNKKAKYKEEAITIQNYIKENSFQACTTLVVILKKKQKE